MEPHLRAYLMAFGIGILSGCSDPPALDAPTGETEWPVRSGVVDLQLGTDPNDPDQAFGQIIGLVLDDSLRIFVADSQADQIKMFSPEGEFLTTIGGPGDGPAEFRRLGEIRFGPKGAFWVNTPTALKVFDVRGSEPELLRSIPILDLRSQGQVIWFPPMLDASDTIRIMVFRNLNRPHPGWERRYYQIDTLGQQLGFIALPPAHPPDSIRMSGRMEYRRPGRDPILIEGFGPYPEGSLLAYAPDGPSVRVLNSRYAIELFDVRGEPTGEIVRSMIGPRVSQPERDSIAVVLEDAETQTRSQGGIFTAPPIPERKPPIQRVWYDQSGRLWVQLYTSREERNHRAHVLRAGQRTPLSCRVAEGDHPWQGCRRGGCGARGHARRIRCTTGRSSEVRVPVSWWRDEAVSQ